VKKLQFLANKVIRRYKQMLGSREKKLLSSAFIFRMVTFSINKELCHLRSSVIQLFGQTKLNHSQRKTEQHFISAEGGSLAGDVRLQLEMVKQRQCDQMFCEKSDQFCPNIAQNKWSFDK
jgi:hypothetical protein